MGFFKTLVKFIGDGCIILSIPLILIGAFGLAGSDITFFMGGRQVTPKEGGQITLIVGIIVLLVGIVITYIRRKKML